MKTCKPTEHLRRGSNSRGKGLTISDYGNQMDSDFSRAKKWGEEAVNEKLPDFHVRTMKYSGVKRKWS